MTAAIIIGVVGLLFAQKLKLPVSTIYVGSLISLVPGGMAFTSITMIHDNNITVVLSYVFNTLLVAISLAVGLGVANQINKYLLKIIKSS
ncbi:threonine/serine exporter family protein, partial [Leuconostoc suionicum]